MAKVLSWLRRAIGGGREAEERHVWLKRTIGALAVAIVASVVAGFAVPSLRHAFSLLTHAPPPPHSAPKTAAGTPDTITGPGGKCVDVLGNDSGGNGAHVDVWDCQPQALDQHWQPGRNDRVRTLGNDCLDIDGNGTAIGTGVELWECNDAGGQKWVAEPNGTLLNPQSRLCLDDPGGSTTNGTQLQIQPCDNRPGEQFTVHGETPLASRITGPGGKCVDVAGDDNGKDHAPVDLWDCQPYALDQHWYRNPEGSLESLGLCLSVDGNSPYVELLACGTGETQKWAQRPDGTLLNPRSGRCLDDPGASTGNGTQLRIWPCNGLPEERFRIG